MGMSEAPKPMCYVVEDVKTFVITDSAQRAAGLWLTTINARRYVVYDADRLHELQDKAAGDGKEIQDIRNG